MRATKKYFTDCYLVGKKYYDADEVSEKLKEGTELLLIAEPENRYDENAVIVAYEDKEDTSSQDNVYKLGYLPRNVNTAIAQLLNMGWNNVFECRITALNESRYPDQQIHLVIRVKKVDSK